MFSEHTSPANLAIFECQFFYAPKGNLSNDWFISSYISILQISPFSVKFHYGIKNSINCSTEFLFNNFSFYFKHETLHLQQHWKLTHFTMY